MIRRPTRLLGDPLLWFLAVVALILKCAPTQAQTPDGRGEIRLERPDGYPGLAPDNPVPDHFHVHNEGGSDQAGLCVICSTLEAGMAQGIEELMTPGVDEATGQMVAGKGSAFWLRAKEKPGGYYPEKLEQHFQETVPHLGWASLETADTSVLDRLSQAGYRVGITMNTGGLYGYEPIAHMVTMEHYRSDGYAMIQDNNEPGVHRLMPSAELDRRFVDPQTGLGWLVFWTQLPEQAAQVGAVALAIAMCGFAVILGGGGVWLWRRNNLAALGLLVLFAASLPSPAMADARDKNVGGVLHMFPDAPAPSPEALGVLPEVIRPKWLGDAWTLERFKDGRYFFRRSLDGFVCFARPEAWGDRLPIEQPPAPDWRTHGVLHNPSRPPVGQLATNDPSITPLVLGPDAPAPTGHRPHAANQPCPGPAPCPNKPVKPNTPAPAPLPIPSPATSSADAGPYVLAGLMVLGALGVVVAGAAAMRRRGRP